VIAGLDIVNIQKLSVLSSRGARCRSVQEFNQSDQRAACTRTDAGVFVAFIADCFDSAALPMTIVSMRFFTHCRTGRAECCSSDSRQARLWWASSLNRLI
jgi:hypothetical protein